MWQRPLPVRVGLIIYSTFYSSYKQRNETKGSLFIKMRFVRTAPGAEGSPRRASPTARRGRKEKGRAAQGRAGLGTSPQYWQQTNTEIDTLYTHAQTHTHKIPATRRGHIISYPLVQRLGANGIVVCGRVALTLALTLTLRGRRRT